MRDHSKLLARYGMASCTSFKIGASTCLLWEGSIRALLRHGLPVGARRAPRCRALPRFLRRAPGSRRWGGSATGSSASTRHRGHPKHREGPAGGENILLQRHRRGVERGDCRREAGVAGGLLQHLDALLASDTEIDGAVGDSHPPRQTLRKTVPHLAAIVAGVEMHGRGVDRPLRAETNQYAALAARHLLDDWPRLLGQRLP